MPGQLDGEAGSGRSLHGCQGIQRCPGIVLLVAPESGELHQRIDDQDPRVACHRGHREIHDRRRRAGGHLPVRQDDQIRRVGEARPLQARQKRGRPFFDQPDDTRLLRWKPQPRLSGRDART